MDITSDTQALTSFFRPRNIALVGASDKSTWSAMIHSRFARFGHEGQLFAVNRGGNPAHGLPGFTSCTEIPEPIDAAYIYVPAAAVISALEDAARAGIRNAVILTSGFAEAGGEGVHMQAEVAKRAAELGIRFMGPNSMGFANIGHHSAMTSINTRLPVRIGRLALISQSGAIANELGKFAHAQGIGLAFTAATGNEAGITVTDILDYLVDDDQVGAIALYVESLKKPDRFVSAAARARAAKKPIVILKLGRSEMSGAIGLAHTGSLVGDDGVFNALCDRHGISRVSSIEELIITADFLGKVGPIDPPRIGFTSISGGACAIYADLADIHGVEVAPYTAGTQSKLREVLPPFAATLNPLDVTGVVLQEPQTWSKVIPILQDDPNMGLIVASTVLPNTETEVQILGEGVRAIAAGFKTAGKPPVIASLILQDASEVQLAFRKSAGVDVTLPDLDFGVRALAHLQRWARCLARPLVEAAAPANLGIRPVGERETLAYLAARGVPVIPSSLVTVAAAAQRVVAALDTPAVLKIASPDIAHKTEAGGVRLNIAAHEAHETFESIVAAARVHAPTARIDGVLVSPMRKAATELIVGVVRDREWGLALTVGIGGILTEVFKDSATRLLPLDPAAVRDMLLALRGAKLLLGYRGQPAADLDALAAAIAAIAEAAAALGPSLSVLEVNPLRVDGSQVEALDGLTIYQAGSGGSGEEA